MIEHTPETVTVRPADGGWLATHAADRLGGPQCLAVDGQPLLEPARNGIDDMEDTAAVLEQVRAYRRAGCAVVESRGFLPFGKEVRFEQVCRYAANHVRVTLDLAWPRGALVRQRVSVGAAFLPGRWSRLLVVSARPDTAAPGLATWQPLPDAPATGTALAWESTQPPAALVAERADGARLELGTGDVWRWERCLGLGAGASGRYAVTVEPGGLRVTREPLVVTGPEVTPVASRYRFAWYAAWTTPGPAAPPTPAHGARRRRGEQLLDAAALPAQPTWCRLRIPPPGVGVREAATPCWECGGVQKSARRLVRQVAAAGQPLRVRGLSPGLCWDGAHLDRPPDTALPHWDVPGLLDFGVWLRQQLGPERSVTREPTPWDDLPSLAGLLRPNGFESDEREG